MTKRTWVDLDVQDALAPNGYAHPARECLVATFKKLAAEELAYGPDVLRRDLHAVDRCGFTLLFQLLDGGDTLYIVELIYPARNSLRGILKP